MTILATVFVLIIVVGMFSSNQYMKLLLTLASFLLLLQLLVQHVLKPFALFVTQQLHFVPYSKLLVVCAIALFLSNVLAELLKQCDLEGFIPFTDVTIRFLLFLYCFKQLSPALQQMSQLLTRLS